MRTFAAATTDLAHLLDEVARRLADVIGDSCVLLTLSDDGKRLTPSAAHAVDPEALARVHALLEIDAFFLETHPAARVVIETRGTVLVPHIDATTLPATTSAFAEFQREQGIHSLLAVALHVHDEPIGLLTLTRYRASSPAFDENDRELAQNLADQASLAISNARLYAAERTARLAAEDAMRSRREADSRFTRLAEAGLLGIIVTDLNGRVSFVNSYVEQMLARPREDFFAGNVSFVDITPPEYTALDERSRQELRETGIGNLREKEYLRPDGSRVPVLIGTTAEDTRVAIRRKSSSPSSAARRSICRR